MDYKVLDWSSAAKLKERLKGKVFKSIDFNLASVYLLEDSSYLIMPLNPFGNSILTKDKSLLDNWVKEQRFPDIDDANAFYFNNQVKIEGLLSYKEALKKELYSYVMKDRGEGITNPSVDDIDHIYQTLKKRKKIKEYKLNFIVLVGDCILEANKDYRWGILENKQLLNPLMNLVIVKDKGKGIYYNLEENSTGKWGYPGMQYILKTVSESNKKSNEIEEIKKVM